jgi:hypothetical protein
MTESELTLLDIVQRLPGADAAQLPPDLWPRIATAHLTRQRRRRTQRVIAAGTATAAAIAAVFVITAWFAQAPPRVDWQARAQALEIQLSALSNPTNVANTVVVDAELARLDVALQAAYDRAAPADELVSLWKQRSELLDALIAVRQQQIALTRI